MKTTTIIGIVLLAAAIVITATLVLSKELKSIDDLSEEEMQEINEAVMGTSGWIYGGVATFCIFMCFFFLSRTNQI